MGLFILKPSLHLILFSFLNPTILFFEKGGILSKGQKNILIYNSAFICLR